VRASAYGQLLLINLGYRKHHIVRPLQEGCERGGFSHGKAFRAKFPAGTRVGQEGHVKGNKLSSDEHCVPTVADIQPLDIIRNKYGILAS
jgi:hypothetical protein